MWLVVPSKPGPGLVRLSGCCRTLLCPAGIAVCIGMASTFAYANSTLREQVSLKVSHLADYSLRLLGCASANPVAEQYGFTPVWFWGSEV